MASSSPSAIAFLFLVLYGLIQSAVAEEDIIWYTGSSEFYTGHKYAWQGTTDGKYMPDLLLASVINQPWLVTISKSKNIIYWTDNKGIIGAWNATSRHSSFVYQLDIGNWDESSNGPALTGLDVDELNNHLYFTFNRSIFRLDLSQSNPSPSVIATYNNLVFNPRFSAERNSLFFCSRNKFDEQGDIVQVSLSDPTTTTTLVSNTSTGSIVQQLFIDDITNTLYYNSPGTLTMRGVSLTAPYNQVFSSIYLGLNPTFFDFNPTTTTFVFGNLRFSDMYSWSLGPNQPARFYTASYGKVTGVKFFNDTHALVAYNYAGNSANPGEAHIDLVNINNPNETSVLLHNFGMGVSLLFDEKYCDFYYIANLRYSSQQILRKNINEDEVTIYQEQNVKNSNGISGIALDVNKRNLIVARPTGSRMSTIGYFPIDKPNTTLVPIIDSQGRSISTYTVNDKTGDIFYSSYDGINYNIYRLDAAAISKDWINNVGRFILGGLKGTNGISMSVDSVNNKLYISNGSYAMTVVQSNLDGSDAKTIFSIAETYGIPSMKWDPASNRLFFLATPKIGWNMISVNSDGSDAIFTSLNYSVGGGGNPFAAISPDPYSDWVYMNSDYYQPLRIKKDGSIVDRLFSYIPFNTMSSIAFDETTGTIYYSDVQCSIRKININNINRDDPVATPFEIAWQGDYDKFYLSKFIHDKPNQMFWLLQSNNSTPYPYYNYTVSVTPVNGGPTKQLFKFPKNVNYPFTIDTKSGKMFAYYYEYSLWNQIQNQAIVMMDLYNGTNLRTLKEFKYPNYSSITVTAMTADSRTGLLYYAWSQSQDTTVLECFDPKTYQTKRLWSSKKRLDVRDIKINDTSLVMSTYYGNVFVYDMNNGSATDLQISAVATSLDPKSNTIYMAGASIVSADMRNINATRNTLLGTLKIKNIAFDFVGKSAYFTLQNSQTQNTPPYYYRSDLDGKNKKKMQVQNGFYVPRELSQFSLFNSKFYVSNYNLDSFDIDGSGYDRIIQNTYVSGNIKYDDALQRVFWQENYGRWFYSCAVYSTKYADCKGYVMFPELQYLVKPQLTSFVVGNNNMVYITAQYVATIYSMDLNIGQPSFKVFVSDPRLSFVQAIATNKAKSALFVTTNPSATQNSVLRISLDGTITTLYSNVSSPYRLLVTDLTHCK